MAKNISPEEQKRVRQENIRRNNQKTKDSYRVNSPNSEPGEAPVKPKKPARKTRGNIVFLTDDAEFEYIINLDRYE